MRMFAHWPLFDQPHQVEVAHPKDGRIDEDERQQADGHVHVAVCGNSITRALQTVDHPRLAANLGGKPARQNSD